MRVRDVVAWLAAAAALLAAPDLAAAQVQPYGTNNYGTFYDVLAPGTNPLIEWVNRPTFQRAVKIGTHAPGLTRRP
jgi:hypothetical protein